MPSNEQEALLECDCGCEPAGCCPERTCPDDLLPNPWPSSLTLSIESPDLEGCWDITLELTLQSCPEVNYTGQGSTTCTWCGHTYDIIISVVLTCSAEDGWLLTFEDPVPDLGDCSDVVTSPGSILLAELSCDPILLQAEDECITCGSLICEGDPGTIPMPYPHEPFCGLTFSVYETA